MMCSSYRQAIMEGRPVSMRCLPRHHGGMVVDGHCVANLQGIGWEDGRRGWLQLAVEVVWGFCGRAAPGGGVDSVEVWC